MRAKPRAFEPRIRTKGEPVTDLFEVVNRKGRTIAIVNEDTAARMAEEIGGTHRPKIFTTIEKAFPGSEVVDTLEQPSNPSLERVRQPWGTVTTRRKPGFRPSTAPQQALLRKLVAERRPDVSEEYIRGVIAQGFERVSKAISKLNETPVVSKTAPRTVTTEVPDGYYAITVDGTLKFYRVNTPTEGRWIGYMFVSVLAGPDSFPVKNRDSRSKILAAIASSPEEAARAYGQNIGHCGRCNRRLTNEESRSYGIGPECREKGW